MWTISVDCDTIKQKEFLAMSKVKACVGFLIFLFIWADVSAQEDQQQMRYAVSGDSVYVYHIQPVPIGEGLNIYRKDRDEANFRQLNDEPVQGVFYPAELASSLGELYEGIQSSLETEDATQTFFTLRSNSILGRLYTFVHPEVADALGRLYIDTTATIGETVTYRIEFVDDLGRPTGQEIEQEFTLEENVMRPSENLEISNIGYAMTVEWEYPSAGGVDDKVIRFEIYQSEAGSDELELVNQSIILRDDQRTGYEHHFSTPRLGREMEYLVIPVDITGQSGPPGEVVVYYIEDNIAPGVIEGVTAEYVNQAIEVTWPVSPETDIAGYHIYKSTNISGEFSLIQEELIDPFDPVFRDSSITEGERYFYKVTAVDQAGNESSKSASAMRHVADKTPPPVPAGLTADFDIDELHVSLDWENGQRPDDFRRYIVLRRKLNDTESPNFSQITRDDYADNELLDSGVGGQGFEEGVFYEYGVLAADSSRNFSDTTTVKLQIPDLTPPEPPANVMADNREGNRIDLSWNHTTSGDAVTYVINRQEADSAVTETDRVEIRERRMRDETVVLGQEYRYAVSAVDSAGNESDERYSEMVLVRDFDPPRSVRNVRVSSLEDGAQVSWEPVVASDLVGYKVYRSNLSTGVYEPLTEEPLEDTEWMDSNPRDGYWYRVRAVDISGNESRPSEPVKISVAQP